MATPKDYLANAERLVSDAAYLHAQDRARSAATLIVVALEQMGEFVEVLTKVSYPDAEVHMGIFGGKTNAHAKRQDALAGHIMNYAFGSFFVRTMAKRYADEFPSNSTEDIASWIARTQPHSLSDEEQKDQRSCPDIAAAHLLLHFVRSNILKDLREYGLYENNSRAFSDDEIKQTISLAFKVRAMLERSWVTPEPFKLVGVNMPEGLKFDLSGNRLA
ncbi:hypothetical protein AB8A31_07750 [Tardiphaga sp. 804_B3_N1_9]|uniref:hypothetical protein n=1 Tax=Tardiphaga TaxID=1395974 RepID=UPI001586E75F|nr:hypothetical protein [Tardiphaga robiniae]NUU43793.1 hypothetical protein [Tardiphaga robiniae]